MQDYNKGLNLFLSHEMKQPEVTLRELRMFH